jgi:hypothetical protein
VFSEFAYGYAVVRELEDTALLHGLHAPFFPTQRVERRVGFDVALNWSGHCWFLQFKRSAELHGRSARLRHQLGLPYYRFEVTRRSKSPQHDILVNLATRVAKYGNEVAYCAPLFARYATLDRHYRSSSVLMNSVFVNLLGASHLPDDDQHYYSTDRSATRTIFTSEFEEDVKSERALTAVARMLESAVQSSAAPLTDALPTLNALLNDVLAAANALDDEDDVDSEGSYFGELGALRLDDPFALMQRIQDVALFALDLAWIPILSGTPLTT